MGNLVLGQGVDVLLVTDSVHEMKSLVKANKNGMVAYRQYR